VHTHTLSSFLSGRFLSSTFSNLRLRDCGTTEALKGNLVSKAALPNSHYLGLHNPMTHQLRIAIFTWNVMKRLIYALSCASSSNNALGKFEELSRSYNHVLQPWTNCVGKCARTWNRNRIIPTVVPIGKCQRVNWVSKQELNEFCNIYLGYF